VTQLAVSGVDLQTLMNRMGHKSAKFALEVYAKANPVADRAAADTIGTARSQCDVAHGAHGDDRPEECLGKIVSLNRLFTCEGL
jgi:hypothetical protein